MQSMSERSDSRCQTYLTGCRSTSEMTWWKSQSLHVPGNTTTPNLMEWVEPSFRSRLPHSNLSPDGPQGRTRASGRSRPRGGPRREDLDGEVLGHRVGE